MCNCRQIQAPGRRRRGEQGTGLIPKPANGGGGGFINLKQRLCSLFEAEQQQLTTLTSLRNQKQNFQSQMVSWTRHNVALMLMTILSCTLQKKRRCRKAMNMLDSELCRT